jgi:tRNA U34 2-thiouridine synthase MnmA/TrmU
MMTRPIKALALILGGLDSMLAARIVQSQGTHVEGINFCTGFCVEERTQAIRRQMRDRPKLNNALWVAEMLGIRLQIADVVEEYRGVVLNPRYGYGANLNPCLDCKIFMLRKATAWIDHHGFDFVVTGEVVGQRPKSQCKQTMPTVQRDAGTGDRLLRPLSTRNLAPALPQREGWVSRDAL